MFEKNIFSNDKVSWRSIFIKDYVQFYIDRNSIPDGKYLSDYFTDSELLLPATIDGSLAGESQDSLLSIMKKLDYEQCEITEDIPSGALRRFNERRDAQKLGENN